MSCRIEQADSATTRGPGLISPKCLDHSDISSQYSIFRPLQPAEFEIYTLDEEEGLVCWLGLSLL